MSIKTFCPLAVVACAVASIARAGVDVTSDTHLGSTVFFDFSHLSNQRDSNLPGKVDVAPTGTGFDVKRLYLSVDHRFDEMFSANITTDAQYSSSATASSGGVTEVFIKKLYLQAKWNDALALCVGAYNAPWAPFIESLYGYRWVEKTTTDRLGFAYTADWGINAGGKFVASGLSYSLSVTNGGGFKNPSRTKSPDVEARLAYVPIDGLTLAVGGYAGHLGQVSVANDSFDKNTATRWDAAIGYSVGGLRVGGEYFAANDYKTVNNLTAGVYGTSAVVAATATGTVSKDKAAGASVWASYAFNPNYAVFARADDTKLSKQALPALRDKYFNVGVAYKPAKYIDLGLVYKYERLEHGSNAFGIGDANGTITIGGSNAANDGKLAEIGLFLQYTW